MHRLFLKYSPLEETNWPSLSHKQANVLRKSERPYNIWLTICFIPTCIISYIIDELQSQVICDIYLIFNSNLLSSNIKVLINEQYMDFRQNIKIYQPQIPNLKYFPQIPDNFTPQIPNFLTPQIPNHPPPSMFPGSYVPRVLYVPRVPMFPGSYVPRVLCQARIQGKKQGGQKPHTQKKDQNRTITEQDTG